MKLVTNLAAYKNILFCYIGYAIYKTFLNATILFTKQFKKYNKEHIKIENQNLNKVFVPHHCHSTLFVWHLI